MSTDPSQPIVVTPDTYRSIVRFWQALRGPLIAVIALALAVVLWAAAMPSYRPDRDAALATSAEGLLDAALFTLVMSACLTGAQRGYARLDAPNPTASAAPHAPSSARASKPSRLERGCNFLSAGVIVCGAFAILIAFGSVCVALSDGESAPSTSGPSPDNG